GSSILRQAPPSNGRTPSFYLTNLAIPARSKNLSIPFVPCLQTLQGIHLKNIQNVKVTPSGPHCAQTEVIATLKNGQDVCLNPEAPMVRRIINKMLNKSNA
uniref:Chemokine interleukin-8-like domain-containing protein n=1 Tax=Ursus maritimus TaxID=29073 RepID=A0A452TKS4_URSMA